MFGSRVPSRFVFKYIKGSGWETGVCYESDFLPRVRFEGRKRMRLVTLATGSGKAIWFEDENDEKVVTTDRRRAVEAGTVSPQRVQLSEVFASNTSAKCNF